MNRENDLILVNMDDREIGYGEKMEVHRKGLLHRAFSVFLFHENSLLIQQRAMGKYHCAGLWANTCCSHPHMGQSLSDAVPQRLMEECGISEVPLHEAGCFVYRAVFPNGLTEFEVDHIFVGEYDGVFSPNPEEIAELRYVPLVELKKNMISDPGKYAPWFFTGLGIAEAGRVLNW